MGISVILAVAMKRVSWGQVANIAIQYGPDIIRKIRERMQTGTATEARVTPEQLGERIRELESALVKQEELIELQNRNIEILERNGRTLQARLNIVTTVALLSAVLSIVLLVLWLRR